MTDAQLVYPMFTLVGLSAFVLGVLFRRRVRAVREGKVAARFFQIYQGGPEPDEAAKAARHFSNLFEAPTLFYAGCITAMITRNITLSIVILAWIYVTARIAHAAIHLHANRLRPRIRAYFVGWVALLGLWLDVVIHTTVRG